MRRIMIIGVLLIPMTLILLFACGGDPAGVTSPISVTTPASSTIWNHYQSNVTIEWNGGSTDNVSIKLLETGEAVTTLASAAPNSGTYILSDRVSPSWGTGTDFTIRIEDGLGEVGNSSQFEIAVSSGEEIIQVTNPTSSTQWQHYEEDVTISWSYPSAKATESASRVEEVSTTRSTGTLSGDSVDIELYQGEDFIATLGSGVSSTAGSYTYAGPVPSTWGTGTDFKVRVVDDLGNYGFSSTFSITESSGQNIITVIQPTSSTEWEYEQTGTTVTWEYPDKGNSGTAIQSRSVPHSSPGIDSDNVRIEIWHDGVKLDDYSGWVSNTGSYTRNDPLPASWGTGFNYQIKIIDESDNYGISENFLISGSIDVTTPDASTVWEIGETNTQAVWNGGGAQIKLEVWYAGVYVDDYSGWIDNNGNYTRSAPIPSSWSIGEHFRIRVVESGSSPNDGYSEEFQIFDEVSVIEPNSETMWAWGEEEVTVQWSENYSDSVYINVYKGGSYLASFSSWVPNTGSYARTSSVPSSWGTGEDFQIKVTGSLGSTGLSEEFSIWAIDITEPNSSTEWYWDQTNTQVLWVPAPGNPIRMEIWKDGSKVDEYCGWEGNDGEYIRSAAIPEAWGEGDDYQIKMIDALDNVGWSEVFTITPDLLPEGMEFVTIPSGSFEMGAPESEQGTEPDERPVHTVTFNYSFEMMTTEVTQAMWLEVMGSNPSHFLGLNHPVEMVSWYDCQDFIDEMNTLYPYCTFRLPSESEWEYACRAGTTTRFYWGEDTGETEINDYAWWNGNSGSTTHPVAQKLPNTWGLYDMSGNVIEWCQDWYHDSYNGAPTDGSAWEDPTGSLRVSRGGWWGISASICRSAERHGNSPGDSNNYALGFRLVRTTR